MDSNNNNIAQLIEKLSVQYRHIVGEKPPQNLSLEEMVSNIVQYYENIIRCMPGNVFWLDKTGATLGCNQNVLDMFNFDSVESFKGLNFPQQGKFGRWSAEATKSFENDTQEVIRTGRAKLNIEELPIPHHDGRMIHFLSSRVPLFNRDGEVIGVVGISFDITERKQMEQALLKAKASAEAANNLKIEFIHNMEHDIRTPFSGIYGIAKLLADQETDAKKKSFLTDIVNCAKELLDYSTGILDFAMIESGAVPLISKKFDLRKLIDGLIAMEMPAAKVKELNFTAHFDDDVPHIIMGDRYRLQRVLMNLVGNAIKFTHQGFVRLSVKVAKQVDSRHIILSFIMEDSGMGIPKEKQNIIYERFSRLIPSNQRLYSGKGLGLRLVKQFVEEMDGDIDITSIVDKGTIFTCTLPFKLPLINKLVELELQEITE